MHQTFRREGKPTDILDRMRSQSRGRPAATEPSSACAMHPRVGDPACNPGDLLRMTCGQLVCRGSALAHRIVLPNCASCHATLQQSMQRDVIDPWKARYATPPPPPLLALPPQQPANHFLYSSPSPSPPPPPPQMSWMVPLQGPPVDMASVFDFNGRPRPPPTDADLRVSYTPPPSTWTPAPYHAKADAIMARQQQQQQQAAAPYPHSMPLPPRPAPLPPVSDATTKALANLMSMLQQ